MHQPDVKALWQAKRERLLKEKIDIAAFMVWFIEQYPESRLEFADNPDVQYRFT